MSRTILLLIIAVVAPHLPAHAQTSMHAQLRTDLLQRVKQDQDVRQEYIAFSAKHADQSSGRVNEQALTEEDKAVMDSLIKKLMETDAANTAWLKSLVAANGWPRISAVGKDGAHAAWLILQHADADREFQESCLELMRSLPESEVAQQDMAYLTDRVLVGRGQKQKFGTQCVIKNGKAQPYPIEDEPTLDERRKKIGLPSLSEYLRQLEGVYLRPRSNEQDGSSN